jgi:hypothetical protein
VKGSVRLVSFTSFWQGRVAVETMHADPVVDLQKPWRVYKSEVLRRVRERGLTDEENAMDAPVLGTADNRERKPVGGDEGMQHGHRRYAAYGAHILGNLRHLFSTCKHPGPLYSAPIKTLTYLSKPPPPPPPATGPSLDTGLKCSWGFLRRVMVFSPL